MSDDQSFVDFGLTLDSTIHIPEEHANRTAADLILYL